MKEKDNQRNKALLQKNLVALAEYTWLHDKKLLRNLRAHLIPCMYEF